MKFISNVYSWLKINLIPKKAKTKNFNLPDGSEIKTKSKTIEPVEQKTRVLSNEELQKIQVLANEGITFVQKFIPDISNPDLKEYDRAFCLWQSAEIKYYSNHETQDIFGCVLGMKMVTELNMEWVEISDEYGTDFAVIGVTAEVFSYPFSSVAKRIQSNEYGFMYAVFNIIKEQLASNNYKIRES